MRVLFLSTNRCRNLVPPYPLGLASVIANTPNRHTVAVWDAMFQDDWEGSLRADVRAFAPEAIGISVRNVDDQELRGPTFFLEEVREMARVCREESPAPVVLGGAGFSMYPAEILRYLGAEFGVAGPGERAFPRLLECLESGRLPQGVPGAVWQQNGQVHATPPDWDEPVEGMAPADRELLDAARYYEARGTMPIPNTANIQGKRGCPLECIYCSTFAVEGTRVRVRSPQSVAEELAQLCERGFTRVQFVDSVFNHPAWHARAVCEEILRRDLPVQWSATVSPAFAEPDLLRLMKEAGCAMVMVGNESACTRMLDVLRKGFTRQETERCFAACEEIGLRYNAFLLLGAPGEDRDSVRESIEVLRRFRPQTVSVSVGIRIYPGCELARLAIEEGELAPTDGLLTPRFYLAPALRDWVWDYLEPIMAAHPNWTF